MSVPAVADATTFGFSSGAEQHVSSNEFYSTIVVQNESSEPVFVAVDGGTATAGGNNEMEVAAGQTAEFDNEQLLPNANVTPNEDMSESEAWTTQSGFAGTAGTYCSVIPAASATGSVAVTFQ